ncbi:hypothetical protein BGZ83_006559 [Gryganskiella cystojenkinii]|nr:hypothetical protein BGZ83_006559 [Gryganskiella cystojenkinii]
MDGSSGGGTGGGGHTTQPTPVKPPPPPFGPYGPILGMGHRRGYLAAAIVMGSICLISTVMTFYLSKTQNDLKQRGRYLVAWNGIAATMVVTVYLMLNAYVGDFPCYVLLWSK